MEARWQGIPGEALPIFEKLMGEELVASGPLLAEVGDYLESVRVSASQNDLVDLELAEALGTALSQLIEATADETPAVRQMVQAAARYLVLSEDAESDLTSLLGFEDDAAVFNAVARRLGRKDLLVTIP